MKLGKSETLSAEFINHYINVHEAAMKQYLDVKMAEVDTSPFVLTLMGNLYIVLVDQLIVEVNIDVDAVVPYYYHRAKIEPASPQKEEKRVQEESFDPTHTICCKIGEKAARKRLSCTADTQFLARKMNHIHKAKVDFTEKKDGLDNNTNTLFYKISKCAVSYSKYFMKCCNYKADFYKERRTCRTMETRLERQKCRQDIEKKYSLP